jgi:hypothetical protein
MMRIREDVRPTAASGPRDSALFAYHASGAGPLLRSVRGTVSMRWTIIAAAAILVILVVAFGSQEYNTSICAETGMTRSSRGCGPFKIHSVKPTALSQVLTQSGYRDPNQHDWVYEHGGGWFLFRRRYSASGNALSLRRSVESPQIASAVHLMIDYTDKATVERWLQRVFDPEFSPQVSWHLYGLEEHTNKQDFVRWLQEKETEIAEMQTNR